MACGFMYTNVCYQQFVILCNSFVILGVVLFLKKSLGSTWEDARIVSEQKM